MTCHFNHCFRRNISYILTYWKRQKLQIKTADYELRVYIVQVGDRPVCSFVWMFRDDWLARGQIPIFRLVTFGYNKFIITTWARARENNYRKIVSNFLNQLIFQKNNFHSYCSVDFLLANKHIMTLNNYLMIAIKPILSPLMNLSCLNAYAFRY